MPSTIDSKSIPFRAGFMQPEDTFVLAWISETKTSNDNQSEFHYLLKGFKTNEFLAFREDLDDIFFADTLALDSSIRENDLWVEGVDIICLLDASKSPRHEHNKFKGCLLSPTLKGGSRFGPTWDLPDSLSVQEKARLQRKYTLLFWSSKFSKHRRFSRPWW